MMNTSLHILVVDDDRRMTRTLFDILNLEGFQVTQANSGEEAVEIARTTHFDCVLSDVKMSGINGVEMSQALQVIQPELPVVLMTAYAREGLVEQGLQAGVVAALEKPLDINQLLSFFASLSNDRTIAIVDDDPNFTQTLGDILEIRGYKVHKITDPHLPVEEMVADTQIVLLDMKLNQIDGHEILQQIRATHPDLPVLLISGYRDEMQSAILKALEINAHACLYKPLELDELLKTLTEIRLKSMRQKLLEN
jgi:two-component system response regulator HydG